MLISWNWLSRHVDLTGIDARELADSFTLKVAELEGVTELGGGLDAMRTVRIAEVAPVPNADKLTRVVVQDGETSRVVVCGAPNVRDAVGRVAVLAPPGSVLPSGLEIREAEIRGVKSAGMLASERELGLSEDHEGILLLSEGTAAGERLTDVVPVHDWVWEVDNKAITHRPDLWGHYGIAREVALLVGRPLRPLTPRVTFGQADRVSVDVLAPDLCPRYLCAYFTGVRIEPSPEWLRRLLVAVGVRPISNVVDLTNFVMMDVGNPLHAFDARFVDGHRIVVRRAGDGEIARTLDGQDRECTAETLLICDASKPVAIAGVMGGENSEIRDDTTEVILEAANFEPANIRRTSTRLGLRTESSARFEKSLDPAAAELAARHFSRLLLDLVDGCRVVSPLVDAAEPAPERTVIRLDPAKVTERLGVEVAPSHTRTVLESLGFGVEPAGGGFDVTVPTWRATRDVSIPEDLIEEVGRIHGYQNIPPQPPRVMVRPPRLSPAKRQDRIIRQLLSFGSGMHEVLSYAFTWRPMLERLGADLDGRLKLANPISAEMDMMRRSVMPNLLSFAERNARYFEAFDLYEIGRVFEPLDGELPRQDRHLGLVRAFAPDDDDAVRQFRELKGIVAELLTRLGAPEATFRRPRPDELDAPWLHPTRSARVVVADRAVGTLSLLHPRARQVLDLKGGLALAEINLDALLAAGLREPRYTPLPRYPAVTFDVSFEVPAGVTAGQVLDAIVEGAATPLLRRTELFDIYEMGEGRRSLSYHLSFRSDEGSLEDKEVRGRVDALVAHVTQTLGARLRGG